MNNEDPKIVLQFVRHGDSDNSDKSLRPDDLPLTNESKFVISNLKKTLKLNKETTVGWSGDNVRSKDTVKILVNSGELDEILDLESKFKSAVDNKLLYKMDPNFKSFKEYLGLPVEQKKLFRVVVNYSDKYSAESGVNLTTYSDMYKIVADYIIKYIKIIKKWERVHAKYDTNTMFRIFCANEYIYSSFRARLTEIMFGKISKEEYIDWYEKNFERDEVRKYEEQCVVITHNEKDEVVVNLKDPYGELSFGREQLLELKQV